jgi:hypothetical protein
MFSFAHYFPFTTLNAAANKISEKVVEERTMKETGVSTDAAQQVVISFVKKKKNAERVEVASVEEKNGDWVFRGTCPIDLEGHPWAEKFEVVVDPKGKIKYADFSLL